MSRTTRTLLILAACVAMSVPAWAQFAQPGSCPDEARNGTFEVDENLFDAYSYDVTGFNLGVNEPPDHWSWSSDSDFDLVSNVAFNGPTSAGARTVQFTNLGAATKGYLWQVVDETLATWEYDQTGWQHGNNTCWRDNGISKSITVEYDYYFTKNTTAPQFLNVYAFAWKPANEAPDDPTTLPTTFNPASPSSDWELVLWETKRATTATIDAWGRTEHSVTITSYQPRYIAWVWEFNQSSTGGATGDIIALDNVSMYGRCMTDTPEPATWVLLASTAAFGGFIRRRRKT